MSHASPARTWFFALWLSVASSFACGLARAGEHPSGKFPPQNLLVGARASGPAVAATNLGQLLDGRIAPEGAAWPEPRVLVVLRGALALDLGAPVEARRLFLQIDADQPAAVALSPNGEDWATARFAADATATGMLSHLADLPPGLVRYVRIAATDPSQTLAITELGLYRDPERDVRKDFAVVGGAEGGLASLVSPSSYDSVPVDGVKLTVASLVLLLLVLSSRFRVPAAAFAVLAAAGVYAYTQFGAYHRPRFVHFHDVFHYFMGAKYFPELGYERLYACASVAEAAAGFPQRVGLRPVRDLATNGVVRGTDILARSSECDHLLHGPVARDFGRDVRYFVNALGVDEWTRVLKDHGFNASPTWIAPARMIARRLEARSPWAMGRSQSMFGGLIGLFDPLLLAAAGLALVWAFGLGPACVAAVVFACNPLSEFSWVGGGFLRQLWFSTLVVSFCLLRRSKWVAGGVALGISASLQVFPAICLAGIAFSAVADRARGLPWDARARRALLGAAAVLALVIPLSVWGSGRSDALGGFVRNTAKHSATPSANLVGLPAALSFRSSTRAAVLFDPNAADGHARVRQSRIDNYRRVRGLHYAGVIAGLLLFIRRVRTAKLEPWLAAAFSLALIPLLVDESSYYTEWLALLALVGVHARRAWWTVLGTVIVVLGAKLLLVDAEPDTAFAISSGILVAGVIGTLSLSGLDPHQGPPGVSVVSTPAEAALG
jgi:hypothetical protein